MSTDNYSLQAQLQAKTQELETALEDYKQYKEENEEYVTELENDNKYKEKELDNLTKKFEQSSKRLEETKKEVNQLSIIMEREKQRAERKTEELNSTKSQLIMLEQYVETLENQIRHSEYENEDLKDKYNNLEEVFILQRETAAEALSLKEEEIERLRQEVVDLKTEITVLKSRLSNLEDPAQYKKTPTKQRGETPQKELNSQKTLRSLYLMNLLKITSSYKTAEAENNPGQDPPKSAELMKLMKSQSMHKSQPLRMSGRRKTLNPDLRKSHTKIDNLWDGFLNGRVLNAEFRQEVNGVFDKIQFEIKRLLENKIDIVRLNARLSAEEKAKSRLKNRVDCLLQEVSEEKAKNSKLSSELTDVKMLIKNNMGLEETNDLSVFSSSEKVNNVLGKNEQMMKEIAQRDSTIKSLDETLAELEKELQELASSNLSISISSFSPSEDKVKSVYPLIQNNISEEGLLSSNPKDLKIKGFRSAVNGANSQKTPKSKFGLHRTDMTSSSPTPATRLETNEFAGSTSVQSFTLSPGNKNAYSVHKYLYSQTELPDYLRLEENNIQLLGTDNEEKTNQKISFDQIINSSEDIQVGVHIIAKSIISQETSRNPNKNSLFLIYGTNGSDIQDVILEELLANFKAISKEARFEGKKHKIVVTSDSWEYKSGKESRQESHEFFLDELTEDDCLPDLIRSSTALNAQFIVDFVVYEENTACFDANTLEVITPRTPKSNLFTMRAVVVVMKELREINLLHEWSLLNEKGNIEEFNTARSSQISSGLKEFEKHIIFVASPTKDNYETTVELISSVPKALCLLTEEQALVLPFSRSCSVKESEGDASGFGSKQNSFKENNQTSVTPEKV